MGAAGRSKYIFKYILNKLILKILFVAFKISVSVATISFLCLSLNECKHNHTHIHTKACRVKAKISECWHLPQAFGCHWHEVCPLLRLPPPPPALLDQVTVNFPAVSERVKRRGSAKSDWWPGSVCLLLLFIHVFILAVVISSDPGPLHPLLSFVAASQRGNSVSLHQVWYKLNTASCVGVWTRVCKVNPTKSCLFFNLL